MVPKKFYAMVPKVFKNMYYQARALIYHGNRFYCPFCKNTFRKFLPFGIKGDIFNNLNIIGGGYRLNCICPVCISSDRERSLYLYFKNNTNMFTEPCSILHIAPEKNISKELCSNKDINYISGDLDRSKGMIKVDVTDIPFKNCFFDFVICSHVLEHVPDDRLAMKEILRVLKPKGVAFLQVPIAVALNNTFEDSTIINESDRERNYGQSDHVRLYGQDYKDRLENVGFNVDTYKFIEKYDLEFINRCGLIKDEILYICAKP